MTIAEIERIGVRILASARAEDLEALRAIGAELAQLPRDDGSIALMASVAEMMAWLNRQQKR